MTTILPDHQIRVWQERIACVAHPRELAIDLMFALQQQQGWLNDQALKECAELIGLTPLELEELATFYPFIYRRPVGRHVIHVCDSVICQMNGYENLIDHFGRELRIAPGETTTDGLFTLLPVCCIGYCDRSPAMMIDRKIHGFLTPDKIRHILEEVAR
jgi:NADH-quinone oxidoreductase subunit E